MDQVINKLIRKFKTNDPFTIASGLNIEVWFEDLGVGTRGLYYKKLRRRYIVIHRDLSEDWQRFICAHELAHDRLHPGFSRFWLDQHSLFNPGKYERQANMFAVRLLLSKTKIHPGETLENVFRRNYIPTEMLPYF
ncbi:ImmA/IrrE family metallo-endopeptidase [Desulforamulus aquiferis]|uniref:ImmA/IrrE family metallo-endopeptidase n=1 Tax=Desulforamulus aquiferis TaxID=1397668 RepID=A0AAW7ZHV5_9FIRM|nr:ImmA/IrrE family metallo-endopeptidase [Desulforamulus aquiferis]MDO7788815.1 ImmA/IrrE family metallo-endopeptidase [Desulforamulus aquiferis]